MPLTRRQSEILKYLQEHIRDRGYAPSFEEIAEQFGFQSLATAHEHLTNLQRKGYIHRTHKETPPQAQTGPPECPLPAKVPAGPPTESIMAQVPLAVPDSLLPRRAPN